MSEAQPEIKTEAAAEEPVVSTELKNIIEALIFASDEPMTVRFIRSIMDDVNKDLPPAEHFLVNADIIRKAVGDLNRGYGRMGSGFRIIEIAGGFTHATQEQFSSWVGKLAKEKARRRLSPTAVETLAIIAYKQPIAKGEVEFIRGVNVDYIINALLEKDLIHITGRANTPGRPLLYGTTQKFLEHFGLNDLTDLPKPREISELINETELEVDRRLLAEQQELEFKEDLEKKLEGNEGSKNKPQKPAKGKVPEAVKEENRGVGRSSAMADDKAADGQRSAEGESSSESNLTTSEATAEALANVPVNPEANGPDHSATGGPESQELLEDRSGENQDQDSAKQEAGTIEIEQVGRMIADLQDLTNGDQENQANAELENLATNASANRANADQDHSTRDDQVRRVNEEQGRSAIGVPDHSVTGPAEHPGQEPALPLEENRTSDPMEGQAEHLERSTAGAHHDQEEQHGAPQGQETGWSKWKNKVKTFFQKLFA